jgi:hypothetical protein
MHVWCFYVIVVVVAGGNAGGDRRVAARLSEAPETMSAGSSALGRQCRRVPNVPALTPLPARHFLNVPVSSRLPGTLPVLCLVLFCLAVVLTFSPCCRR